MMNTNLEQIKNSTLNTLKLGWVPKEIRKSNGLEIMEDVLSSRDYLSRPELKELIEKLKLHQIKRNIAVQKQEWKSASLER